MVRIPTFPGKKEVQALASKVWVNHLLNTLAFISRKGGEQAVKEYMDWMAEQTAETLRAEGEVTPRKFAEANALTAKNLYGCKVKVDATDHRATVRFLRCRWLETFQSLPASKQITRQTYCENCLAYFSAIAEKLGLRLKGKLLSSGCRMTIKRR
ncbi:MAG: hypothetical protein ACXQTV_02620 [Candidatus Hecatellaceae archaeon]